MTSDLLSLSYAEALKEVVLRALEKRADLTDVGYSIGESLKDLGRVARGIFREGQQAIGPSLGSLESALQNPHIRRALVGAAIGSGLGALSEPDYNEHGRKKSRIGKILRMGLLGGTIGGSSGILTDYANRRPAELVRLQRRAQDVLDAIGSGTGKVLGGLFSSVKSASLMDRGQQAQDARRELGILGADEIQIDPVMARLRWGKISPGQARRLARRAVPGMMEQFRNIPEAVNVAAQQGDLGNVAAQLDVVGLKNINPFAKNFSPLTALASGGLLTGGLMARRNLDLHHAAMGLFPGAEAVKGYHGPQGVKEYLKNLFTLPGRKPLEVRQSLAQADPSKMTWRSMLGRYAPVLALASAPLIYREWLGSGYRSGTRPIESLTEINTPSR